MIDIYSRLEIPAPASILSIVPALLERLMAQGIRYGLYKNIERLDLATAGCADFDLIVDPHDASRFRAVMVASRAVQGTCQALCDNAESGGREDWFVPDASGVALHLDVSFGLRIGPKFNKRYLALHHGDIAEWSEVKLDGAVLPVVSPREAARIAVLRSIFRLPSRSVSGWARLDRPTEALLGASVQAGSDIPDFVYRFEADTIACAIRRHEDRFEIANITIRQMRSALRSASGNSTMDSLLLQLIDPILSGLNKAAIAIGRRRTGGNATRDLAKRKLLPRGIIVALIGPDGVGKSTQSASLLAMIGRKFRCEAVYLGSNEGSWMAWRGRLRRAFRRWIGKQPMPSDRGRSRRAGPLTYRKAFGKAVWRLVIAVQRTAALRKCRRLADRGIVVISDRWPQTLRYGYMDGPSKQPPAHMKLPRWLWTIEKGLCDRMVQYKPDVTIHLDCDFATSLARKPGDISEEGFGLSLALMREMRERDPDVKVVDVRQDRNAVTAELARWVWLGMHQSQFREQRKAN